MSFYEYVCEDCLAEWEESRPMKDASKTFPCLACKSTKTRRVYSSPALVKVK